MRLPRTVNICGKTYVISKNSRSVHSTGGTHPQKMIIGTKGNSSERIFESYMHEVLELVACELHLRYVAADDDIMIIMNHKQFDDFAANVAAALKPMVS